MSNQKIDAWASFFTTFTHIHYLMEMELKRLKYPSLEIYDVLWTLEEAPDHRMRLSELGLKVYLAKFNISRIVDRLMDQGLILKSSCPNDKRGVYACLTDEGLKVRKEIWQVYKKMIDEHFSNKINLADHKELKRIFAKIYQEN
jgi:DNA-binding MarR family transcriptional regulator